jgi:hypothetical protein
MSNKNDRPLQVIKPAILPDDNIFYWILAVEITGLLVGAILHNRTVALSSLMFMAVLPGMPLFFHAIFHLTVTVKVFDDKLTIHTFAGSSSFIKIPWRQEIFFKDITYVYYLDKEIKFLQAFCSHQRAFKKLSEETDFTFNNLSKKYMLSREYFDEWFKKTEELFPDLKSVDARFFLKTNLNLKKYTFIETRVKGYTATARSKAYLVLSDKDGNKKVYFANFYDLSGKDSRGLLKTLKEKNPSINFLMNTDKIRRLFS